MPMPSHSNRTEYYDGSSKAFEFFARLPRASTVSIRKEYVSHLTVHQHSDLKIDTLPLHSDVEAFY
jgi:hypothetical protein